MKQSAMAVHLAGAALFAAAAAWTLQQQAGYVIASWRCGYDIAPIWLLTAIAFLMLGFGGWLSWRALRPLLDQSSASRTDFWRPRQFLSMVGYMAILLFLFAILMQAGAAFFLPGCVG